MARSTKREKTTKPVDTHDAGRTEPAAIESEHVSDPDISDSQDKVKDETKEHLQSEIGVEPPLRLSDPIQAQNTRGEIFPAIIGGLVVALVLCCGAFVAERLGYLTIGGQQQEFEARIRAFDHQLSEIKQQTSSRLDGITSRIPDLSPLEADIKSNRDAITVSVKELDHTRADLTDRIHNVETQPIPEAELPAAVVQAYEAKLAEVDARIDERFAAVSAELNDRLNAISTAEVAAKETLAIAEIAAERARAAAALARIGSALETGMPMAGDLDQVSEFLDDAVPEALVESSASGVSTLDALQADFPKAAREAISIATREAAQNGEIGTISAFLKVQLGARSLEPREGDDADAVLSRAEAALKSGDLAKTLEEIGVLSPAAKKPLELWIRQAMSRKSALDAFAELSVKFEATEG